MRRVDACSRDNVWDLGVCGEVLGAWLLLVGGFAGVGVWRDRKVLLLSLFFFWFFCGFDGDGCCWWEYIYSEGCCVLVFFFWVGRMSGLRGFYGME